MDPIQLQIDIQSKDSLLAALNDLSYNHFSHYPKIHKQAKQNQKAHPIDLTFVQVGDGADTPLLMKPEEGEMINRIMSVIEKRYSLAPEEQTQSEIAFFAEACLHAELVPAIRTWLRRLATYNYGSYSPTMCYQDYTPVGYWASLLLAIHQPQEMEIVLNYLSSLIMPNRFRHRRNWQDNLYGFEHPSIFAGCHYLYQTQGWNEQTLKLLCVQLSHYWYNLPEEIPDLFKSCNPKEYLLEPGNLESFVEIFIACYSAFEAQHDQGDIQLIIEEVLPLIMECDQLENIRDKLLSALE